MRQRAATMGRGLSLLGAYAVVVGALSVAINLGAAVGGETPAVGRAILGAWGLAAGLLLWSGRRYGLDGRAAILLWAIAQIPVIAWNTHGGITTQIFTVPASVSSRTTVNGVVTSSWQYGINLAGVALAIWAARSGQGVAGTAVGSSAIAYAIEHHAPGQPPHPLGTAPGFAAAQSAAVSQAARLRAGGQAGEILVVERPSGAVVAREVL
jgi:hypothetical protein